MLGSMHERVLGGRGRCGVGTCMLADTSQAAASVRVVELTEWFLLLQDHTTTPLRLKQRTLAAAHRPREVS